MVLGLSNAKGGVGKTTIAVHLAIWLIEQGYKVAFVDSDVQGSSSGWLKEAAPKLRTVRLLTSEDLIDQMALLHSGMDYVIVDGPAGLSEVTRTILCLADMVLFPCGPSALDLRAVIEALDVVKQVQQIRSGPPEVIVVPNKLQMSYRLSKELLQTVKSWGMPVGEGLCLRQAYADAAGQGSVVWKMNTQSAKGATAEFQMLFQQLISYDPNKTNAR